MTAQNYIEQASVLVRKTMIEQKAANKSASRVIMEIDVEVLI